MRQVLALGMHLTPLQELDFNNYVIVQCSAWQYKGDEEEMK
jgi:hypothetical protein